MATQDMSKILQKLEITKQIISTLQIKLINGRTETEIIQADRIIKLFQDINLLETEMPICENDANVASGTTDASTANDKENINPIEHESDKPNLDSDLDFILDQPILAQNQETNTDMSTDPLDAHTTMLLINSNRSYETYMSSRKYDIVS